MMKQVKIIASELALKALTINQGFVDAHTVENHNDNRSEQIDAIEREWGLSGLAYCAMGECHVYAKAIAFLTNRPTDFPTLMRIIHHELSVFFTPSPLCQDMVDASKAKATWREDIKNARPGDLVFFNWSGATHAQHVEMFVALNAVGSYKTIGWNTTPGPDGNQSDGGGVYRRVRSRKQTLGYISINLPNFASRIVIVP